MSKFSPAPSTLIFAFIALSMAALAAGMWITGNPDLSSKVAALEAKVREDEAIIARLQKPHAATLGPSRVAGAGGTLPLSAIGSDPGTAGELQQGPQGASGHVSVESSPPPPDAAGAPVAKSNKRLAEAEARYADLINQFGLQPDEKEAFKDLAAKRDDIRKNTFSKLSDPSLNPQQRQAILGDAKAQMSQVDDSVRQFLNNDGDYNTFEKWEAQNIERGQMDDARAIFEKNGATLSPEQERTLIDQTFARRISDQGLGDPYSADTLAGRRIDQNYITSTLAKYDADTAVLLQNARSYMTQPQIASFQAVRYQQRVQLESRLWGMARTTTQ